MEIERERQTLKNTMEVMRQPFFKNKTVCKGKTKQNKRESENGNEMKNEKTFGAGMEHAKFYSKVNSEKKEERNEKHTRKTHTTHITHT